jgi:tetratricopeptide (TPR) repeat protein
MAVIMMIQPDELAKKKQNAVRLYSQGYLTEAMQACLEICESDSKDPNIFALLGVIYGQVNQFDKAAEYSQRAINLYPQFLDAHHNFAFAMRKLGRIEQSMESLKFVLSRKPHDASAHYFMGVAREWVGEFDGAVSEYRTAQSLQPDYLDAYAGEAGVYEKQGKYDEAYRIIRPYVENTDLANSAIAAVYGRLAMATGKLEGVIEKIERFLNVSKITAEDKLYLHFVMGSLCDKVGRYDDAFRHYEEANRLKGAYFDFPGYQHRIDELINRFSQEQFTRALRSDCSSARPIFIVGMMRSGTSLVEQILASHSKVFGAGELPSLDRIVTSMESEERVITRLSKQQLNRFSGLYMEKINSLDNSAMYVIDKMPQNFMHLGYIALLFPGARIIHCKRNPVDTCLSCYFQNFAAAHSYTFDLEKLGQCYLQYRKLMNHWKQLIDIPVLEVCYEELVRDPDTGIENILELCGLDTESQCFQFHKNRRAVLTASYEQVRRPIYSDSVERWRNYEKHIGRLIEIVGI